MRLYAHKSQQFYIEGKTSTSIEWWIFHLNCNHESLKGYIESLFQKFQAKEPLCCMSIEGRISCLCIEVCNKIWRNPENLDRASPWKFNSSPLKNDGWKTIIVLLGPGNFIRCELLSFRVAKPPSCQLRLKRVVWGLVVWDAMRVPLPVSINPFHKETQSGHPNHRAPKKNTIFTMQIAHGPWTLDKNRKKPSNFSAKVTSSISRRTTLRTPGSWWILEGVFSGGLREVG